MSNNTSSGEITIFGALGLLFVGLKLGKVIDWSWWWVLSPFWGTIALALAILALVLVVRVVVGFFRAIGEARDERSRRKRLWR